MGQCKLSVSAAATRDYWIRINLEKQFTTAGMTKGNDPRESLWDPRGTAEKSKACQWTLFHPMGKAPHACHALCFRRAAVFAVVQMRVSESINRAVL
ncbi:protein of unknown function [Georgfuchsia toluolica]|uniref:Uncharacterized protein n=1 Tax=Georgfuchsia toluolica TaxID=424218 RepID=A0A916J1D4_9PROT|nr:protein of unknown function [Georgfuchsia toluolica]